MNKTWKTVITLIILSGVPILIGLPLQLAYKDRRFIEVFLIITGLLELLVLNVRFRRRETKRRRDKLPLQEEKESVEYVKYVDFQRLLVISGVINIVLSILYFLIFGDKS